MEKKNKKKIFYEKEKKKEGREKKKNGGGGGGGKEKKTLKKTLCLRRNMNVAVLSIVQVQAAYLLNLCSLAQYIYIRHTT